MDKSSVVTDSDSVYLNVKSIESSSRSPSPNNSLKGFNLFRVISKKISRGIQNKPKDYKGTSSDEDEDSNSSTNVSTKSSDKNENQKDNPECDCDYFKNQETVIKSDEIKVEVERENEYEQKLPKKCLKFRTPCRHHGSSGSDTCSSSNDDSSESNDANNKFRRSHSSSNDSSTSSSSVGSLKFSSHADVHKKLKKLNINSKSLSCFSISQIKGTQDGGGNGSKDKRIKKSPQRILRPPSKHTYVRGISGLPTLKEINTRACYNNQYSRESPLDNNWNSNLEWTLHWQICLHKIVVKLFRRPLFKEDSSMTSKNEFWKPENPIVITKVQSPCTCQFSTGSVEKLFKSKVKTALSLCAVETNKCPPKNESAKLPAATTTSCMTS